MFRLTIEQYEAMSKAQRGRCAICRKRETWTFRGKPVRLAVDHDHRTRQVRGLLCHQCNRRLGVLDQDARWTKAAIAYLQGATHA